MSIDFRAPLLFDGAFGTYYFALTSDAVPCERANLTDPETVRRIHREYIEAGVDAIKTNTFAASPVTAGPQLREILTAGWRIANEAAAGQVRVFADIGSNDFLTAERDYIETARIFLELGARAFLFETLAAYSDAAPAIAYIKQNAPDALVLVSFAVSQDGYTRRGLHYKTLIQAARGDANVDGVGLNCVCGPSHMLSLIKTLEPHEKPLTAMPNSGYPTVLNGRVIYEDNADYFAQKLAELYEAGVDIVGGCCGSTPRHLLLGREALAAARRSERTAAQAPKAPAPDAAAAGSGLTGRGKLIAVEVDPPQDADCTHVLSAAAELKECGADLITIADSPLSRTRADSIMTAAKVRREIGIEVLPHLSCRDRNRIALKAALLGASFEDIRSVLVITGDPPEPADSRVREGVFNFNSFDLISYINSMNSVEFTHAPFTIGGALNVNAVNFPAELARAKKKLARGARMIFTQPIFSDEAVENFLLARKELDCTLFAGILPVAGYKNAMFLINEVAGVDIPDQVVQSLKDKTPEEAAEISIAYSAGVARRVYSAADGFYIMTPLRKINIVRGLINEIRRNEP